MNRCLSLLAAVAAMAWFAGCADRSSDPVSSQPAEPLAAAKTVSNRVAAGCETPPDCRPGFAASPVTFTAQLSRSQEVPAIPAPAGTGTFTLNPERTSLTYEVRVEGIPAVTGSHFHSAAAGVSGGVVRAISGAIDGGVWVSTGTWSSTDATQPLTAELLAALQAGTLYVNIHSADYPAGEIRGQVLGSGSNFTATLNRSQEVPAIPEATGTGTFTLNAARTALTYEVRVEGIPAVTGSHFHKAAPGVSGGVVRAITGAMDGSVWVASGTWRSSDASQPLTMALLEDLLMGNLYVNIHSADYPAGEIRGQVVR